MKTGSHFRKILALTLCAALMLCAFPAPFAAAKTSAQKLSLATLSDLHFYPSTLMGNGGEACRNYLSGSNTLPDDVEAIVDAALGSLKYEHDHNGLKYAVICGDLTVNGEYEGNRVLAAKLKKFEKDSGVRLFVINGNHDINNSNASEFSSGKKAPAKVTSPADFLKLYKDLGFSDAYHTYKPLGCGTQGCLTYSVKLDEGYRLILADGGKYSADATEKQMEEHETAGAFSEEQTEWLLGEIADAKKNGEIPLLFTHWNFAGMNSFHEKLLQGFVIDDAYRLQEIFADAGCHYVFSGHQHQTDVNISYSDAGEPLYSVITPTLTEFPFAYRVTGFTPSSNGNISAKFEQKDCDRYVRVRGAGGDYPSPFRKTGFMKQFGGSASAPGYLMMLVKGMLGGYADEILEKGSILDFIEEKADIDIEETINGLLKKVNRYSAVKLEPGKNVMSFLRSLDTQLTERYIYDLPYTYSVIEKALVNLCSVRLSDRPCSVYLSEYGFGSTTEGGTLGDLLLDILATMYYGNEDISGDAFMKDVLKKCAKPEFVDLIFDAAKQYVVQDVVIDEIFANTNIDLRTFFLSGNGETGLTVQLIYNVLLAVLGSGVFTATSPTAFVSALSKILSDSSDISLAKLIDAVLGTGLISYGKTTQELMDGILGIFFGEAEKKATANQLHELLDGLTHDDTKDHGVTYKYTGAEKVVPTREDMQLPSNLTISVTDDAWTSFTVTWFTKYSVTADDIEVVKSGSSFKGTPRTKNVVSDTVREKFTGYGFDFGSFGILPWERDVNRHTVTVTGLTPGTKYKFRVGDFAKGFTSDGTYTTAADDGRDFTFISVSDSDGTCPGDYGNLSAVLSSARNNYPDAAFALHSGNFVKDPANDRQWTWALDGSSASLRRLPLVYTAGSVDSDGSGAVVKHFTDPPTRCKFSECGEYYSFDYQDARFIVLNTNYLTESGTLSDAQYKWLTNLLANNEQMWTVLSLYSDTSADVRLARALNEQLQKLMNKYSIDLILQGGGKAYIRTDPFRNGVPMQGLKIKTVNHKGTDFRTYLTDGGTVTAINGCTSGYYAGAAKNAVGFAVSKTLTEPTYSAVTVSGDTLFVTAYTVDKNGNSTVIDRYGLRKDNLPVRLGDVDFDGHITPADSRLALRLAVGLDQTTTFRTLAADADRSGTIGTNDARAILRVAVGFESFPTEFVTKSN